MEAEADMTGDEHQDNSKKMDEGWGLQGTISGKAVRLRLLLWKQSPKTSAASTAKPPTTPPTIAPTGDDEDEDEEPEVDPVADDVREELEVVADVKAEVVPCVPNWGSEVLYRM